VMSFLFPGGKLFTLVMISSFVFIVREWYLARFIATNSNCT
jgi:hypothetical protein